MDIALSLAGGVILLVAEALPEYRTVLRTGEFGAAAIGFFLFVRRPVYYRSLVFDAQGFRQIDLIGRELAARWHDVVAASYVREIEPWNGMMETAWEITTAAGERMEVIVEWRDRRAFAEALAIKVPGFSRSAAAAAMKERGEGRWTCMASGAD